MRRTRRRGAGRQIVKAILLVLLMSLGAAAGAYHFFLSPEARHQREALRLIRTFRMDESEHVIFVRIFDRSLAAGRISQEQHDCIVDVSPADLARMQARGVSAYLTVSELKQASAYFESTTGQKVLRYLHQEMTRRDPDYPIKVDGASPEFDIDDMEKISSFRRTPVGMKVHDVVSVSEQTFSDMEALIGSRQAKCGAPAA